MARSYAVFQETGFSCLQTASTAKYKVKEKYHTPICRENCNLTHHELVLAMFMDGRYMDAKIPRSGDLPIALKQRIECAKLSGWDENSDIPDPLEELRCPLLFLACAFGKIGIVKALLQNNFDPRTANQHGETALHHTAQHLWSHYVEPCRGAKGSTTKALDSFERIVKVLTDCDPKILAMKDGSGRTALHVLAVNIMLCQKYNFLVNGSGMRFSRDAHFHQSCLKSMIRRLLKLLDASIFTRREIMEIITTAESTHGDSVLHILARNCSYGFEVMKFLQDWLFAGKLPDDKNRENKTVLAIAWETEPQDAEIRFSPLNSLEDGHQQPQPEELSNSGKNGGHQQPQQESPTQSTQYEEMLISNDGEVSTTAVDVNATEPQIHHSSNLEVFRSDLGTGNPFPQCALPVTETEGDLPYITQVFSLCCKESLESSRIYDPISNVESLTMPRNDEFVESHVEINPTIPSPRLENVNTKNSYAEVNLASTSPGLNSMNSDNSFGLDALALVRQNMVGVALNQYSDKLTELEETLPKLDHIIQEAEAVIDQKMTRVTILETELGLVKRSTLAKLKSIEELRWKKELVCEEMKRLKRKVDFCQEKQNQFVSHCKKGRSS